MSKSFFNSIEEQADKALVMLDRTIKLNEEVIKQPVYQMLHEAYAEAESKNPRATWKVKATISIMNAAITQGRMAFILTKQSIKPVIRGDENWTKKLGFKDSNYASLRMTLQNGTLEEVETVGRFTIFKVVHPMILQFFNVDVQKQADQAIEVARGMNTAMDKKKLSATRGKDGSFEKGNRKGNPKREPQREPENEVENENEYDSEITSGSLTASGGQDARPIGGGSPSPKNNIPDTTPDDEWDYSNVPNHDRHGNYIPPPEERKALEECKIALRGFGGSEPKIHHSTTSVFGETWDVAIEMIKQEQAENANKPPMLHGELDWQYEERVAEEALANDPEYQESKRKFEELL